MRQPLALAVALTLAVSLGAACGGEVRESGEGVRTVDIRMELSRFEPAVVEVPRGTRVRFRLANEDPIDHEFIVGDAAVHARHETGTEPSHGDRPGEVSVPALSSAQTTYDFVASGDVQYACHLPGHLAYGMTGVVRVR